MTIAEALHHITSTDKPDDIACCDDERAGQSQNVMALLDSRRWGDTPNHCGQDLPVDACFSPLAETIEVAKVQVRAL